MKNKLKVLIFDYETSPAKGYFFGSIWETNIIEIIEYEQILCVSWRWQGEKKTHVIGQDDFKGYKKGILNDKVLVEYFSKILSEADIVIGHNSDQFDIKVFTTRLLYWKLPDVTINKTFDTKKIAKSKLHLPSNKLDHIADFLGIERKMAHTGTKMWLGCEKGIESDWKMMKKYCGKDTDIEDAVVERLLPLVKHTNEFTQGEVQCSNPICLSWNTIKHKRKLCINGWKQQYQCKKCGSYKTDSKLNKYEKN